MNALGVAWGTKWGETMLTHPRSQSRVRMKPTPVRIVRLDVYVSIPAVEIVQHSAFSFAVCEYRQLLL